VAEDEVEQSAEPEAVYEEPVVETAQPESVAEEPAPAPVAAVEPRLVPRAEPKAESQFPAIRLSAGVGGFIHSDFGGGVEQGSKEFTMPYYGGGGYLFVDAVYAEFFFGYGQGCATWKWIDFYTDRSYTNIGILAKYQFDVGVEKLKVSPVLGIDYEHSTYFSVKVPQNIAHDGDNLIEFDSDGHASDFRAL